MEILYKLIFWGFPLLVMIGGIVLFDFQAGCWGCFFALLNISFIQDGSFSNVGIFNYFNVGLIGLVSAIYILKQAARRTKERQKLIEQQELIEQQDLIEHMYKSKDNLSSGYSIKL